MLGVAVRLRWAAQYVFGEGHIPQNNRKLVAFDCQTVISSGVLRKCRIFDLDCASVEEGSSHLRCKMGMRSAYQGNIVVGISCASAFTLPRARVLKTYF